MVVFTLETIVKWVSRILLVPNEVCQIYIKVN